MHARRKPEKESALEEGFSWAPAVVVPIGPLCHSPPAPICASHIAPGTGIQLSPAHPLHPGRLLIVAIIEEKSLLNRVLRSDDGGSSWLPSNSIQVIPAPSHVLDRISPIFPRFFPLFARFHRLAETVPTSPKPKPRSRKRRQGDQERRTPPFIRRPRC